MAVSKRLRYEVLRRDNYTCRYCGESAPDVKVTIDHVVPKALGGSDDPANLVTACKDCNGGKTSTNPDAPLVADVAQDALRWAKALTQSAEVMLAEQDRFSEIHDQFDAWWTAWTCGPSESEIPRPPDWKRTVDIFMATGLPLPIFKGCLDKAMGTPKVIPAETFRYMCGIAWKKVAELQDGARRALGGGQPGARQPQPDDDELTPEMRSGRADLACEMLGDLPLDEIDRYRAEAREHWQPETADDEHAAAIQIAWSEIRIGRDWLMSSLYDLLRVLPDGLGHEYMRQARTQLYNEDGPGFSTPDFYDRVIRLLTEELQYREASTYLDALPEDARAEWVDFAIACFTDPERVTKPSVTNRWIVSAANCARWVSGGGAYRDMCGCAGTHIRLCPERAVYRAKIREFECCGSDAPEEHVGHPVCERHLKQLMDGAYTGRTGMNFSATDFSDFIPESVSF